MKKIEELLTLTQQLEYWLDSDSHDDNHSDRMARVLDLLENRENLLSQIEPPFTDKENEMGRQAMQINERVERKMNSQFSELKQTLKQVKQQKKSNRTYINPYAELKTADGMYMDSRN